VGFVCPLSLTSFVSFFDIFFSCSQQKKRTSEASRVALNEELLEKKEQESCNDTGFGSMEPLEARKAELS